MRWYTLGLLKLIFLFIQLFKTLSTFFCYLQDDSTETRREVAIHGFLEYLFREEVNQTPLYGTDVCIEPQVPQTIEKYFFQ